MVIKRTPLERSFLKPWKGGPVRDWTTSPRLYTGRPKGASKAIAETLIQFLERYEISLTAFSRHTEISAWAVRQAKASVRSLSPRQELLIRLTIERIQAGRLWVRRVSRQRFDLDWIYPTPYKPRCPTDALYMQAGLNALVIPYRSVLASYAPELECHQISVGRHKVCACGCEQPVFDRQKWASPGCRQRAAGRTMAA